MRAALLVLLSLSLVACSTIADHRAKLQTITIADLEAAIAIAQKHDDAEALQCYPVLLQMVKAKDTTVLPVKGAISAFEGIRVVLDKDMDPQMRKINLACAALFTDAAATVAKLASKAGLAP